jgi:ketosteroid isomerase-like protein
MIHLACRFFGVLCCEGISKEIQVKKNLCAQYLVGFLTAILFLATTSSAAAQDGKKKNKSNPDATAQPVPLPPTSDSDQIFNDIGEMLAAFQLGKVDMMHKYYSDNATFVSSDYAPPIIGWANYAPLYQRQWAAFQGVQLNRRNTVIFTHGDVAWATYEWEFDGSYADRPYSVRGQTTLVFNKVGSNWLIVHNHTSEIIPTPAVQQTAQQETQPPQQSTPAASGSVRP